MGQRSKARYVLAGAFTTEGYRTYLNTLLHGLEKVFILKGAPGAGQTVLINRIGHELAEKGYDIEFLSEARGQEELEGLIVPNLKIAVIDGNPPHPIDPLYPGVIEEIINLGEFWDSKSLEMHRQEIIAHFNAYHAIMQKATQYLKTSKDIYDHWESSNQKLVDQQKLQEVAEKLLEEIFSAGKPRVRHLFAHAITSEGMEEFKLTVAQAVKCFTEARKLNQKIERFYAEAMDPQSLENVYHTIMQKITKLENGCS